MTQATPIVRDHCHGFHHPQVLIVRQPNDQADPVVIGTGSWIGVGSAILMGAVLGRNTAVDANSVAKGGRYPSHAVIATPQAEVLFRRHDGQE
jgi:acetyltransferase-like isoleucine patch superfamily enzyme